MFVSHFHMLHNQTNKHRIFQVWHCLACFVPHLLVIEIEYVVERPCFEAQGLTKRLFAEDVCGRLAVGRKIYYTNICFHVRRALAGAKRHRSRRTGHLCLPPLWEDAKGHVACTGSLQVGDTPKLGLLVTS